jgi:hypothetical protein
VGDVANWEATQRNVQGAGDQAARRRGDGGSPTKHAKGVTASFGFVDGTNNTTFNNLSCVVARDNAGGPAAQLANLAPGGAVLQFRVTARGRTFPSTLTSYATICSYPGISWLNVTPACTTQSGAPAQHWGEGERADEHVGFPGGVERRIYRSAHLRRRLLVFQVEVWLLYLETPLQSVSNKLE